MLRYINDGFEFRLLYLMLFNVLTLKDRVVGHLWAWYTHDTVEVTFPVGLRWGRVLFVRLDVELIVSGS